MGALGVICARNLAALNPAKSLTQYTRTVWTQEHGLPQDTIRAIAQTTDGNLWLGTDEGLARFDGYEFAVFNKDNGDLPSNSIAALAAAPDGGLWIGTSNGLTLQGPAVSHLHGEGRPCRRWRSGAHRGPRRAPSGSSRASISAGSRPANSRTSRPGPDMPLDTVRSVAEDRASRHLGRRLRRRGAARRRSFRARAGRAFR